MERDACRVLIVEDDGDVQQLLRTVLRKNCGVLDVASDGEQAIEMLRSASYDVVLLDLMLPIRNGFEVAEAISALPNKPRVIVLSAIANHSRDSFPSGTVVLQKPFEIDDLQAALRGA
jgi:two-component system, OmpR family, response regulator ArlR